MSHSHYSYDLTYEHYINEIFFGKHREDVMWLYLQIQTAEDIVDSLAPSEERKKRLNMFTNNILKSEIFKNLMIKYQVRPQDFRDMSTIISEIIDWPPDECPFENYEELENFNKRLMSSISRCVVPLIFYEVVFRDVNSMTREYLEICFTQQMMAMQIIKLIVNFEDDCLNGQHYLPQPLRVVDIRFLKRVGDDYMLRALPLKESSVAGNAGSAFVCGLSHIYDRLFASQL
jgi:hypothetical protein